jgi:hypothetical protein
MMNVDNFSSYSVNWVTILLFYLPVVDDNYLIPIRYEASAGGWVIVSG